LPRPDSFLSNRKGEKFFKQSEDERYSISEKSVSHTRGSFAVSWLLDRWRTSGRHRHRQV